MFESKKDIHCVRTTDTLICVDCATKTVLYNRVRVLESIEQLQKEEKIRAAELKAELAKPNPNHKRIDKLNEILFDIGRSLRSVNQR